MIILDLFFTFLKIGAVSFGGGYGMISLLREEILLHGWMDEEAILNMIAISESTPGPIAVNMATFVGADQAGFFGAFFATLGVVLPAFLIILLISVLLKNIMKYHWLKAFFKGIRPTVIGLILATAITFFMTFVFSISHYKDSVSVDFVALFILALLVIVVYFVKKIFKKTLSPICLIMISAALGMFFYAL